MNKIIYSVLVFIFFTNHSSFSQDEQLVPLRNNPVLINEWKRINAEAGIANNKISSATNDTLLLPFIDDFSAQYMFPRPDLWKDSAVFINADFPIHPPTIGVATFDGLNRFGNPYNASNPGSAWCDTLTSKPLNTHDDGSGNNYPSVYLSFFYEQKGQGERPDGNDYLRLQFLDSFGIWHDTLTILGVGAPNVKDYTFTRVQITISNPIYLYKGFRFRFRNYGSPAGNVDHWHIDYVTLKGPPNFSDINDVAFTTPGQSLLNGLTAMPYTHYKFVSNPASLMLSSTSNNNVCNNYSLAKICRFVDAVYDPSGTQIYCNGCVAGSNNWSINGHDTLHYNFPFSSFFYPSYAPSTALFDVINHMESTSGGPLDDVPQNDTIHYYQKFYNYYAHDDGTAEAGYNLNVAGASLAYKFHVYKQDDLHAIQFYFTQIGASVANQLFNIEVRTDNGGQPNNTPFYQKLNQIPAYSNIIDGFVSYTVNPPQPLGPGDYYFGFTQSSNVGLEVGFDANVVTAASNIYYKTTGGWTQSSFAGSLMIRPVFTPYPFNVGVNEIPPVNILSVYPNPVSSVLHIDYDTEGKKFQYELIDVSGRAVLNKPLTGSSIDVSGFSDGFYVLRVFDAEKKNIFQEKVIIHH